MTIKRKIIILLTMVTTITGLVIYLVILPTIKDIRGINEDVYAERVDLEKKYLRGQLLRKTVEDFEKIRPEKDKLSSVFIPEKEELKFITDLEKIAANNNLLQIIGLEQSKDAGEKGNFYPIPLRIKTSGEFGKILKYLKDLEKLSYYFNISSIQINSADKSPGGSGTIDISFAGKVYILAKEND